MAAAAIKPIEIQIFSHNWAIIAYICTEFNTLAENLTMS